MLVKVKAFPEAGKEETIRKDKNSFEIWVKEKPQQGRANRAVIRKLSEFLKIPQDKIRIIKGFKQRNKIIEIKDYDFNN